MESKITQVDAPQRKFLSMRFPGETFIGSDQTDKCIAELLSMMEKMRSECDKAERSITKAMEGLIYKDYADVVFVATCLVDKAKALAEVADFAADTVIETCKR